MTSIKERMVAFEKKPVATSARTLVATSQSASAAPVASAPVALPRQGSFQDLVLGKASSSTAAPPATLPRNGSFQDLVLGKTAAPAASTSAPAPSHEPLARSFQDLVLGKSAIEERPAPLQKTGSFQDLVLKKTAGPAVAAAAATTEPVAAAAAAASSAATAVTENAASAPSKPDRRPSVSTKIAMLREKKKAEEAAASVSSAAERVVSSEESSAKRLATFRAELGVSDTADVALPAADVHKILEEASALVNRASAKPAASDDAAPLPAAAVSATTTTTQVTFQDAAPEEYKFEDAEQDGALVLEPEAALEHAADTHDGAAAKTANAADEPKPERRKSLGVQILGKLKRSFSLKDAKP